MIETQDLSENVVNLSAYKTKLLARDLEKLVNNLDSVVTAITHTPLYAEAEGPKRSLITKSAKGCKFQ